VRPKCCVAISQANYAIASTSLCLAACTIRSRYSVYRGHRPFDGYRADTDSHVDTFSIDLKRLVADDLTESLRQPDDRLIGALKENYYKSISQTGCDVSTPYRLTQPGGGQLQ